MRVTLTVPLFSIVMLLSATEARADPCAGAGPFGDVPPNASYCTDATWARNASITTGCGTGVNFCPGDSVTRAQMVLFLRRTAAATFPAMRFTESATLPPGDLDSTGVNRCTTPALALFAGANASFAHVDAVASMQAGASAADVQMSVTSIVDGVPFDLPHLVNPIVTVPAGQWRQASVIASFRPLFPGTSTVWRIDLVRAAGSATTGELTALRCQIKVVSQMAPL